jgi:hypothetical protein
MQHHMHNIVFYLWVVSGCVTGLQAPPGDKCFAPCVPTCVQDCINKGFRGGYCGARLLKTACCCYH